MGDAVSFDVFLIRFENGKSVEISRDAVRGVLARVRHDGPGKFHIYDVRFDDGGQVEFSAEVEKPDAPFVGCAFFIRGWSDGLLRFMLDVATAADLVILAAMEPLVPVIVAESQRPHLPRDLAAADPPALCRTPEELGRVLMGGYEAWSRYRDFIVRQGQQKQGPT